MRKFGLTGCRLILIKKVAAFIFRIWVSLIVLMIVYIILSSELAPRHLSHLSGYLSPLVKIFSFGAEIPWNRFSGYLPQVTLDLISSASTFCSVLSIPLMVLSLIICIEKFGSKGFISKDRYVAIASSAYRSRFGGPPIEKNRVVRFLIFALLFVIGVRFFFYTYVSHKYFAVNNMRDLLLASVGSAMCLTYIALGAYGSILTINFYRSRG